MDPGPSFAGASPRLVRACGPVRAHETLDFSVDSRDGRLERRRPAALFALAATEKRPRPSAQRAQTATPLSVGGPLCSLPRARPAAVHASQAPRALPHRGAASVPEGRDAHQRPSRPEGGAWDARDAQGSLSLRAAPGFRAACAFCPRDLPGQGRDLAAAGPWTVLAPRAAGAGRSDCSSAAYSAADSAAAGSNTPWTNSRPEDLRLVQVPMRSRSQDVQAQLGRTSLSGPKGVCPRAV